MTELQTARRVMNALREDLVRCRQYRSRFMVLRNQATTAAAARSYIRFANQYGGFAASYKRELRYAAARVAKLLKRDKS